jgi:hypothetical protein
MNERKYSFMWCLPERVIFIAYRGTLERADMAQLDRDIHGVLNPSPHPVHFLVDVSQTRHAGNTVGGILKEMTFLRHPRLGWSAFYGSSPAIIRMVTALVTQAARVRYRYFPTRAEAIAFLKEIDESLTMQEWSLPPETTASVS